MKTRTLITTLFLTISLTLCTACGTSKGETAADDTGSQTQTAADDAGSQAAADTPEETDTALIYMPLSEGDTAPDFTASLADGGEFTLSDKQDKIVLLNFWATWCGPCVREMPAFEKLSEEYGEDVSILAVNCMESADTVAAFIEENGYTFPIAIDEEGAVSMKYPTQGIPYTLLIDGDGVIQNIYVGALDADTQYKEYKTAIDAAMDAAE